MSNLIHRNSNWLNDAGSDLQALLASGDPGPGILAKETAACNSKYPTAAKHPHIGKQKDYRNCLASAQSDASTATANYQSQIQNLQSEVSGESDGATSGSGTGSGTPPNSNTALRGTDGSQKGADDAKKGSSSDEKSNSSTTYAIIALVLLLLGAGVYFFVYKPTLPATVVPGKK